MADTFVFSIKFADTNGGVASRRVEARSEEEAIKYSGIQRSRIVRVGRDRLAELERLLPKSGPSIEVQARILAVFSAQVSSGANPSVSFDRVILGYPSLRAQLEEVKKVQKVSEKMAVLKFDAQLQLLAEVGEASGLIGQVLGGAADEIIERQKVMNEIRKQIVPSLGVAVFGLLILLVLPIFMTDPIESIGKSKGIKLRTNTCTDIMMFIGNLMHHPVSWAVLTGAVVALGLTARYWWPLVKNYPGFSYIDSFFRVQNAYKFCSAFLPLFSRGVPIVQAVEMLHRFAKGPARPAYEKMGKHLTSGGAISDAFEGDYWDPVLRDCMRGFDTMRQEHKIDLLRRILPLMSSNLAKTGARLGSVASLSGLLLAVGVTMIVFVGLTIPLMTVSTPFTGG